MGKQIKNAPAKKKRVSKKKTKARRP